VPHTATALGISTPGDADHPALAAIAKGVANAVTNSIFRGAGLLALLDDEFAHSLSEHELVKNLISFGQRVVNRVGLSEFVPLP
jgi:hypothetical protein